MTVVVLHLSDIHIYDARDSILGRGPQIASAVQRHLRDCAKLLIILSGDIAQSGQAAEYALAEQLLVQIKQTLAAEFPTLSVEIIVAPGNHDCDFSGPDEIRDAIVGQVEAKYPNVPQSFLEKCTECQSNYFAFRERVGSTLHKVNDDRLWTTYELESDGKRVLFDVLNASWMSTRHEKQGGLLFPFEQYSKFESGDGDLRIGVLHHPYGWYSQRNQAKFRSFMQGLCDVVFTGHEHDSSARISDDLINGECAYVEGAALFERDSAESGFNVVMLDLSAQRFQYVVYGWENERYEPRQSREWMEYRQMPKRAPGEFAFTASFLSELTDPGATLRHPSGRELVLEDVYVYPDLDARDDNDERRRSGIKLSARALLQNPAKQQNALIEGVELAGKTRLLFQLAANYRLQGYIPVYLSGLGLRGGPSESNIDSCIQVAVTKQYGREAQEAFDQKSKSKKVLLLDDFDACRLRKALRAGVLEKLVSRFAVSIVTVSEDYEFSEMLNPEESRIFSGFTTYRMSPFGYQRRRDLIRKWMALGANEETSKNELLQMEDDATKLIESARLQHVASSVPIFILSLLQGSASGLSSDLKNSSFASYYHFLIVGAFERAKVRPEGMQKYIAVCTHLSWFVRQNGVEQRITYKQFEEFVSVYSREWTATKPDELCNVLEEARILNREDDNLSFSYPYAYYYFLGRYASISLNVPEVQEYLRFSMEHLYVRECANTLLFLAHHTGTSQVLDHLVSALAMHFDELQPVTLSKKDVTKVAQLISNAPALKYQQKNPDVYRNEQERWQDENDTGNDGLKDKSVEAPEEKKLGDQLVSLTKSIEIAGALLSHQYANYTRATKEDAIDAIFNAAMRAVRRFYAFFEQQDSEELIKHSADRLSKGADDSSREKLEAELRLAVGWLIRAVTTGLVLRAGSSLTASDLSDNVESVVNRNPTNANRLIRISQILAKPTALPRVQIDALLKSESDNPCVMSVLQALVMHRLYMYETRLPDKDWAMSVFKLGGHATKLELRHRR